MPRDINDLVWRQFVGVVGLTESIVNNVGRYAFEGGVNEFFRVVEEIKYLGDRYQYCENRRK